MMIKRKSVFAESFMYKISAVVLKKLFRKNVCGALWGKNERRCSHHVTTKKCMMRGNDKGKSRTKQWHRWSSDKIFKWPTHYWKSQKFALVNEFGNSGSFSVLAFRWFSRSIGSVILIEGVSYRTRKISVVRWHWVCGGLRGHMITRSDVVSWIVGCNSVGRM